MSNIAELKYSLLLNYTLVIITLIYTVYVYVTIYVDILSNITQAIVPLFQILVNFSTIARDIVCRQLRK